MKSIAGSIVVLGASLLTGTAASQPPGADARGGLFVVSGILAVLGLIFMFSRERDAR